MTMRTEGRFVNGIEGRHVLLGLVVFFGVMLVANSLLVYYALDTFSGGARPDPYRAGLHYNDTIAAAERQAALGWQTDLAYDDARGRLSLRFMDKADSPVAGLDLEGMIGRPATNGEDRVITFKEIAQGVYTADLRLAPGDWVVSAAMRGGRKGDPLYRLKQRLFVAEKP
jgi:nitrogen fixation protein FixH